jgi:predicted GTPase
MTLLQEIHSLALPIIFTLNKVDQISSKGLVALLKSAQSYLDFAKYIPIVPIVATEGKGLEDMMKMVGLVQKENQKRV